MKQAPVLSEQDMKRMLKRCGSGGLGPRNRCMMMLSWRGGMRVGEIAACTRTATVATPVIPTSKTAELTE
jgi:integrase/recombinase XerD